MLSQQRTGTFDRPSGARITYSSQMSSNYIDNQRPVTKNDMELSLISDGVSLQDISDDAFDNQKNNFQLVNIVAVSEEEDSNHEVMISVSSNHQRTPEKRTRSMHDASQERLGSKHEIVDILTLSG